MVPVDVVNSMAIVGVVVVGCAVNICIGAANAPTSMAKARGVAWRRCAQISLRKLHMPLVKAKGTVMMRNVEKLKKGIMIGTQPRKTMRGIGGDRQRRMRPKSARLSSQWSQVSRARHCRTF